MTGGWRAAAGAGEEMGHDATATPPAVFVGGRAPGSAAAGVPGARGLRNFCQLLSNRFAFFWTSGSSVERRS